ncbi:hypothetical protein RQP46_003230 [Phenoliferia psychrophenolica]
MATIDSLPNETLCKIMGMLKEPSLRGWDNFVLPPGRYDALRAAALVCSRWRDPAQQALFDTVEISTVSILPTRHFYGESLGPDESLPTGLSSLAVYTQLHQAAGNFLAALSRATKYKLKTLRLLTWGKEHGVTLSAALFDIGPRLQSFVVESKSRGLLEGYLDVFPMLGALECLSWKSAGVSVPLEASDTAELRTILDAFPTPATLTHLSIGTSEFSSLEHIRNLLDHPAAGVAAMATACEERGIRWSMGGIEV